EPRAGRSVRVEAFAHHHGGRARLPIADRDVVAAGVAGDHLVSAGARHVAAAAADDDDELGLPVDLARDFWNGNGVGRAGDAGRLLGEPDLMLGDRAVALADVVHVVEADGVDLAGSR